MRYVIHNYLGSPRASIKMVRRTRDDAGFKENDHPRQKNGPNAGQFAPKGGGGGGGSSKLTGEFAKKFSPSTSPSHLNLQVKELSKMVVRGSSAYRQVPAMLLDDLEKHKSAYDAGSYAAHRKMLEGKIIDSLARQKQVLFKKGDVKSAAKIQAKLVQWGAGSTQAPSPNVAPVTAPVKPKSLASPEELEKAKSTAAYTPYDAPDAAQPVIKAFNDKYAGKSLISEADLDQKVAEFKQVKNFIELAKASAESAHKEQLKQAMKEFHINDEQADAYIGLAKMNLGSHLSAGELVDRLHQYEKEAKQYGYPISGFECALVKSYSNGTYNEVNSALRQGSWDEEELAYVKVLNSALSKMPTHTGTVYRGSPLTPDQQSIYKVGKIVEERGFTSTSTDPNHSQTEKGNTKYTIKAKGRRSADIKKLSHHGTESEVLFQARTFFKVTNVENKGGKLHVHMEEYWND